MQIAIYELLREEESRRITLQVKETFECEHKTFHSADDIYRMMNEVFRLKEKAEEYVYMLAFDIKIQMFGVFEISHGTFDSSFVDMKSVFTRALHVGASCIILVHNHPSGNLEPSKDDILVTERMKEAGKLLGIELMDHLIVGKDGFKSILNYDNR